MIINIRGTHGSGKTTIVRNFLNTYPTKTEVRTAIRRRPWGYFVGEKPNTVFVPGQYDTPCGGCDSIPVVADMFSMITEYSRDGHHVLYEGILAQHYALKKFLLLKEFQLLVLVLDTPLDQCIEDTKKRRDESGKETSPEKLFKLTETISTEYRNVMLKIDKLKANNIDVRLVSRDVAFALCLELLKGESCKTLSNSSGPQENAIV